MTGADVETTLLFSGGNDSTLAAVLLADRFDRVRLLTYDHGRWSGHFRLGNPRRRARELERCLGADRIVFDFLPLGALFHRFVTSTLLADYKRFRTNTCCVGCKLAMHTRTVLYNLRRGIRSVSDGSVADQAYHAEQLGGVLGRIRRLYARYGITHSNPSFHIDEAERKRRLLEAGITPKGVQPRCLVGAYDFFIYTPLHVAHHHEEDVMVDYMEAKLPIAYDIIDRAIAEEGLEVPEPVAEGAL